MEDFLRADRVLDCKGLLCPLPLIKIIKAIKEIQIGQVLEVLATDPGAKPDLAAWAKQTRHELVSSERQGEVYRFLLRRSK
jgi:tRNA 2-thiouridine synthesizing protein A